MLFLSYFLMFCDVTVLPYFILLLSFFWHQSPASDCVFWEKRINFQYSKRRCQGNWKRMPVNVELKPEQQKIQNPKKILKILKI